MTAWVSPKLALGVVAISVTTEKQNFFQVICNANQSSVMYQY